VREDPSLLARRLPPLEPDPSKLRDALGWRPSITFEEMVAKLVDAANPG
jgi:nucleoside-diphosphate-sugar epimerase